MTGKTFPAHAHPQFCVSGKRPIGCFVVPCFFNFFTKQCFFIIAVSIVFRIFIYRRRYYWYCIIDVCVELFVTTIEWILISNFYHVDTWKFHLPTFISPWQYWVAIITIIKLISHCWYPNYHPLYIQLIILLAKYNHYHINNEDHMLLK